MLKHLKRVFVSFQPGDAKAVSARELLQRVSGDRAKKSNPGCKIEFKVDEDVPKGGSYVELHFQDGESRRVTTAGKGILDIARIIEQKGNEMEMRGVFKEVGFEPWKGAKN